MNTINIYKFVLISLFLSGCATSPLEKQICDGFNEWLDRPLEVNEERSVLFDRDLVDDEMIAFSASMSTNGPIGDTDLKLYSNVGKATHYIDLPEYTKIVARCLRLKQQSNTSNKMIFSKTTKGINVSAVWVNTYCSTTSLSTSGCFSLTQSNQ